MPNEKMSKKQLQKKKNSGKIFGPGGGYFRGMSSPIKCNKRRYSCINLQLTIRIATDLERKSSRWILHT